jgi:phosphate:Na+ symporter
MNFSEIEIWPLLAGLGLFLFGMYMLEEALKALAGRSFKKFLRKHTTNPIKAVLSGTLVTAVLQSSSMVSLLVMSFAGAGIIGLQNGIGMILGANLGTTMTGWLVSLIGFKLDIGTFILPFLAIGGLGIMFLKTERLANFSKFLMGFSFMFLGLNYMKNGFAEFSEHIDFGFLTDKNPLLFVLIGALLSASIQSSSAAMMIFLSSLAAGVITLDQGFYLVIGGDLGTTITAIIGTINGNSIRKKVGWSQFTFNMFTAIVALSFMFIYKYIILDMLSIADPLVAMVAFHSMFNLSGIIIILPFLGYFTKFIDLVIVPKEQSIAQQLVLSNPAESHAATEALQKETALFLEQAIHVNKAFLKLEKENANDAYFKLKHYESEVVQFYLKLQQNELSVEEVTKINQLVASIRNATLSAKDLKDIKHNLDELSNSATDRLFNFYKQIKTNQKHFYTEVSTILNQTKLASYLDIEQLANLNLKMYQKESEDLYELFTLAKESEADMSSLLNMLREINNSNEAMLRALSNFLK